MIAWNGVEKMINKNEDIIYPYQLNETFYENLKPIPKSDLGFSSIEKLKTLKIKL